MVTKIDKAIGSFVLSTGGTYIALTTQGHLDPLPAAIAAIIVGIIAGVGTWGIPNKTS